MENFFTHGSPYLNHPLLTPQRTSSEVDFLQAQWDLKPGARILDVGCGFGRHSIELARRGYEVTGIDPSGAMIEAAISNAQQAGVTVDFRQDKGETFAAEKPYDGAICLFTSLGQVGEDGDNRGLIENVAESVKDGAWFVVEVPQRETAVQNLRPLEQFGTGEHITTVQKEYEPETQQVSEYFHVVKGSEENRYLLRYRLFSRNELVGMLQNAGFLLESSFADYQGQPLQSDASMMLLFARKRVGFPNT